MTALEIIELVVIGVAAVSLLAYVLINGIKNKWFGKILATIEDAIKEAEKLYPESGSGDKKKDYVIKKIEDKCNELGIPYALLKTVICKAIDKIVANYNVIAK